MHPENFQRQHGFGPARVSIPTPKPAIHHILHSSDDVADTRSILAHPQLPKRAPNDPSTPRTIPVHPRTIPAHPDPSVTLRTNRGLLTEPHLHPVESQASGTDPRHPYKSPGVHVRPHRTPGVPTELKVSGTKHMRSHRILGVPIEPQASGTNRMRPHRSPGVLANP
ncbi:hypothetical protein BV22DRAFT_536059 [Leucogyrophana mollusca]|uniref:Uncharacterized protein n=1 Tax=Leucogyrophana mollusca TaxID=85980 RepID=A0ACB8BE74_9AGAM|nr:hypothetical protein BV22DRAFT_536059 [Leucogyrophana mollusca]